MAATYLYQQTLSSIAPERAGEYEQCVFTNCDFSERDLTDCKFIDCVFKTCNLSLANLTGVMFSGCEFLDSKMLGLRFDVCNGFGLSFSFTRCQMNHCSFYRLKIKKTKFKSCQLYEADFSDCDLSESVFDNCDLSGAVFAQSVLEKSDFRTALGYSIDPEVNRIKKAKFSLAGVPGLLSKYDIAIE